MSYIPQYSLEDEQYKNVVASLLARHLVSCSQYDDFLARLVELNRHQVVIDLAVSLLLDPQVSLLLFFCVFVYPNRFLLGGSFSYGVSQYIRCPRTTQH